MTLPWKKSKSSRISRFVTDLHQSPKHGGSLVVETGFPTSLIDLFVKNRDRLKKPPSSKRSNNKTLTTTQTHTALSHSNPTRRRCSSSPPSSPALLHHLSLQRHKSLPQKLEPALVKDDLPSLSFVKENRQVGEEKEYDGGSDGSHGRGGGGCVLMVVVIKVFMVAVLALSTKKLAVGITLSAFALLFLELVVARVFTVLNICPDAQIRLNSLIRKLIGKRAMEQEESSSSRQERRSRVSFEIIEELNDEITQVVSEEDSSKAKSLGEEKQIQTIRDVVFKTEKSKSAKLKSKIVKKIVPKKLRSYKKKKKMMKMKEKEEEIEVEEEGSIMEVSSMYPEERMESDISEKDDISLNPPLLESYEDETKSEGDLTKAMFLIMIPLTGLLGGKVFAIGLTLLCCLILRVFCYKSQTSL